MIELSKRFEKAFRKLDPQYREEILKKIDELGMGLRRGKPLKGGYKHYRTVRVARGKYRLFYTEPQYCIIVLEDIRPRDSAYR